MMVATLNDSVFTFQMLSEVVRGVPSWRYVLGIRKNKNLFALRIEQLV